MLLNSGRVEVRDDGRLVLRERLHHVLVADGRVAVFGSAVAATLPVVAIVQAAHIVAVGGRRVQV